MKRTSNDSSSPLVLDQVDHQNVMHPIQSMIVLMRNGLNYHQVFYFVHFLISPIKVKRKNFFFDNSMSLGYFFSLLDFKYPVHSNGYLSIPPTNGNQSSSFTHSFGYSAFAPTLPIHFPHNHHHPHHPPPAPVAYLLNENRTSNSKSSSSSSSNATSSHRVLSSSK